MQDDRGILGLSGRLWYARRVLPGRHRLASADRMKNYPGYRDIGLRSEQVEAIVLYRSERRSMSKEHRQVSATVGNASLCIHR